MKRIFLLLLAVGLIGISETTAQVTIDSNYRIIVTQAASNNIYTIDINSVNFSSEQEAKQVFNFFAEHPALSFEMNYADSQVVMKVRDIAVSHGTVDLNYLNGVLKRRSLAYQRLF